MVNVMIRNKKKAFIQKTNEILSDPELKLSKELKALLVESIDLCEKGENKLSFLQNLSMGIGRINFESRSI